MEKNIRCLLFFFISKESIKYLELKTLLFDDKGNI